MDVHSRSAFSRSRSQDSPKLAGVSRRRFIGAAIGAAAVSVLSACSQQAPAPGGGQSAPAQSAPAQSAAPAAPPKPTEAPKPAAVAQDAPLVKAPDASPKRGGVIKIGGFGDPAHFDLDQSPTIVNLWPQSPMYDNLVRFNPNDGGRTIIPDLAEKWEVSPDGSTYTFKLRQGVKFHDGTPFTADDVIATYNRRKDPPQGVVSIRQELFKVIKSITAPDPLTVKFELSEPRGYFMEALATGWSVITSKKSLEENKGDLRRVSNYPGTGPYKFVEFKPREKWVVEKNPDYWNKEVPYVDRIERISIPQAKDRGTAVLAGQIDFADHVSLDTHFEALKRPNEVETRLNPVTWAFTVTFNTQKPPFNDPRVRRAVHLVISRQDLAKTYEVSDSIKVGSRWCHPGSVLAGKEEDILKLPGYREKKDEDIAEAKKLMEAAGLANGVKDLVFLQRDLTGPGIEIYAPAFQDMLKRHLKMESIIKPVETSVYWDVVRAGDYHMTYGVPAGAINDPSDYFAQWFKTNGPQNYAKWSSAKFDEILNKIDREADVEKRKGYVREAEDLLDQEVPMFFHGWGQLGRIWRKNVKGLNHDIVGSYMVLRYDTVWLDK
ncbi:MAG: ABC transporter substrate-binding protein [Chloroflexota bacterium]